MSPFFVPSTRAVDSPSLQDKKKVIEFLGKTRNLDGALASSNLGDRYDSPTSPPFGPLSGLPYPSAASHFPEQTTSVQPTFTIDHPFEPTANYDGIFYMLHTPQPAPPAPTSASIATIVEDAMLGRLDTSPNTTNHMLMTTLPPSNVQWDPAYISPGSFSESSFYPTGDTSFGLNSAMEYFSIAQYDSPSRLMNDTPKEWVNSLQQIQYYFNRVRKMQYCFAGSATTDIMRDMVVRTNSDSSTSTI